MKKEIQALHEQGVRYAKQHQESELGLIGVLQRMDQLKGYRAFDHVSLYAYATQVLKLSESVAYNLIAIARRSVEVPALREKIESESITVTNARLVSAVLTPENQDVWLAKAEQLPKRELEREMARLFPERAVNERARFVAPERMELKLGISPEALEKFKRAQDLVCQSTGKSASLEDTLSAMLEVFLERRDPLRWAERAEKRKTTRDAAARNEVPPESVPEKAIDPDTSIAGDAQPVPAQAEEETVSTPASALYEDHSDRVPARKPYPAALIHALTLRDGGRCVQTNPQGVHCQERRWVDFHHRVPRSEGGADTLDNIITLCRAHHRIIHAH